MQTLNRILQKVAQAIFKGFFVFATAAFAFLLAILLINVFSRNFLDGSIAAIEEGSRFVFTWMMFLGISIGVYRRKHLGVDFLVEKYPPKLRRAFNLISDLLTLALFLILAVYGFKYSASTMRMYSPIMSIPYGLVYLCVPLCGVFSSFYCIARIINDLCNGKEEKK